MYKGAEPRHKAGSESVMNDTESDKSGHRGRKFRAKRLKTVLAKPERPDAPLPEQKTENRIAKVMARAGVASRREAETLIAAGACR